ncbi:hypothetical protein [Colwellia psychrerythraea]|uniref:Uncharacterized protein n=1 Tax=Colwellia psychrerythraea (strain 34H / ATCC BAA-681) TaxID=167879 RepID=Q485M8_COLP3|nr:hypothetical protein [Colwellia psychrerythraea]AAZ28605.1 hypothetical protein CPS_1495 [Colwellia psychrerythraea 34H]
MGNNTKKSIEQINDVSRQLLSRILVMQADSKILPQEQDLKNIKIQSIDDENKELTELTEKRQILMTKLFEQNTADSISSESEVLEEMITLDSKLIANAKLSKQAITEKMIKIKKSKKVTKSYQKY